MKMNLLELVQSVLASIDGDEVNSIADTTESTDVARIVRECYEDIIAEVQPHEKDTVFHLDASTDILLPCVMYLPEDVDSIKSLKYNIGPSLSDVLFRDMMYLEVPDFLKMIDGLNIDDTWVGSQNVSLNGDTGFYFKFRNDESPRYYTSPDDYTLIFDAYDSSYETTLTSARSYGVGPTVATFTMSDAFVPKLDSRQFPLLLNSAKAQAAIEIRQTANQKAEQKERKHKILAYKSKNNTDDRSALQKRKGYGR